jgi:hypothetical protein
MITHLTMPRNYSVEDVFSFDPELRELRGNILFLNSWLKDIDFKDCDRKSIEGRVEELKKAYAERKIILMKKQLNG